ncbi:Ig-like domain-containing protein, partial [Chitinimonas sp.]|uniref:Ig-like domain-containing protein n=1 Tax=Chitinimonas sp. TaxID=1934313 RepID=UPI0035B01E0C
GGSPVLLKASGLPDFVTFTQTTFGNRVAGVFHVAPHSDVRGDFTITLTASNDGAGNAERARSSSSSFVLSATSLTMPPQLVVPAEVVALPGQLLRVPLLASDQDQDQLDFAFTGLVGARIVTGNYGQAWLEWTPPSDAPLGSYPVELTVRDSGEPPVNVPKPVDFVPVPHVVKAKLNVVLKASNSAPELLDVSANGQTLASQSGKTVVGAQEGKPLAVSLLARDADGDKLNWTAERLPMGMSLKQTLLPNGQAQLALDWTPNVFAAKGASEGNPNGVYTVVLHAGDGMAQLTHTLEIRVAHVNHAPSILPMPIQQVAEGDTLNFDLITSDIDADGLVLNLLHDANTPQGVSFDPRTGSFEWTPPLGTVIEPGSSNKVYSFTFSASDGIAPPVMQTVQVRVMKTDRAPQIFASNHALQVGRGFSLDVIKGGTAASARANGGIVVNNLDGTVQTQALTVAFDNLPAGARYDAPAGKLIWTPGPAQVGDFQVTARVSDSFGTTSTRVFTLRVAADASSNAPVISVTNTPSMPAQPGQSVLCTVRASSFADMASITVQYRDTAAGATAWTSATLDDAGQFTLPTTTPGMMEVRVQARDVDGFSSSQTSQVWVADPQDSSAPALAWSGALQGDWGSQGASLQPVTVQRPTLLQAQLADRQLMGWQLQLAPAGSNSWTTLSSQTLAAENRGGMLDLGLLDPSSLANGSYQLRLSAWDLAGRHSEIKARLVIDTASKQPQQALETDAVFRLGNHDFALNRQLPAGALANGELGGWSLPLLNTHLTTDQPAQNNDGSTLPWHVGARLWLQMPASLATPGAANHYLSFTLATRSETLGAGPGAPTVLHPVFAASQGWTLQAVALDAGGNVQPGSVNLQKVGPGLYDEVTGLPWQAAAWQLTGPDGTRYTLDAQGNILSATFADQQQWLIGRDGIALLGGDASQRIDFVRNAQGAISRISGPLAGNVKNPAGGNDTQNPSTATVLYSYDARGRLEQARTLGNSAGNAYGYQADGSLITSPLTAQLGESTSWPGAGIWRGTLGSTPVNLGYIVRDSELAATIKAKGASGTVLLAVHTQGQNVKLSAPGADMVGPVQNGNFATTLLRVSSAGAKLLTLTGSGDAQLQISVVGDVNLDGKVDGNDIDLFEAALSNQSTSADLDGNGKVDDADRQLLYANYGFASNTAPQAQASVTLNTHAGLAAEVSLSDLARDLQGDAIHWRVLASEHGSASLAADGKTLHFVPAAGFSGSTTITVQADDGFAASAPITVTVNVSAARLQNLHIKRLPSLATGSSALLQVLGDFADQQGVALPADYLQWSSSDAQVVSVDGQGRVHAQGAGTALITATAHGISASNVVFASATAIAPNSDQSGNELDTFPLSVDLAAGTGQRQIDVYQLSQRSGMGVDYSTAQSGTRYFISDPNIASISADGLIKAKSVGSATITVINGGLQSTIALRVMDAATGPVHVSSKEGAVTVDGDGNTLMIGGGALPADTTASIQKIDMASLDLEPPCKGILEPLAAVNIDIGGLTATQPLQLAVKVNPSALSASGKENPLQPGTQVLFWREGEIRLADGSMHKTWWLIDDGVIGDDGMAHTASPPYNGLLVGGRVFITGRKLNPDGTSAPDVRINPKTGELHTKGETINVGVVYSNLAKIAIAMGAFAAAPPGVGLAVISLIMAQQAPTEINFLTYDFAGTYQKNVPSNEIDSHVFMSYMAAPAHAGSQEPDITGMDYEQLSQTLTLTGTNFVPGTQHPSGFRIKVWLEPRGNQLTSHTKGTPERGLVWQGFDAEIVGRDKVKVVLPRGISLSQHTIYVERIALTPDSNGIAVENKSTSDESSAIEGWMDGTNKTVVTTKNSIELFEPTTSDSRTNSAPITLRAHITVDQNGKALQLAQGASEPVVYSTDGTLAYVAGANSTLYVVDMTSNNVVYSLALQRPSGRISGMVLSENWLYISQIDGPQGKGGLSRVRVDQLSRKFLAEEQNIQLPGAAATNFVSLAVNINSYLAITAREPNGRDGAVYFLDLNQVKSDGRVKAGAVAKLAHDAYMYPDSMGRNPVYIISGKEAGQFLLCNRGDMDRGLASIQLHFDSTGQINGATSISVQTPNLAASVPYIGFNINTGTNFNVGHTYHQDIQSADSVVMVEYGGEQYAIVSDKNLWFQDPLILDTAEVPNNQTGGKLGIVKNPFGLHGEKPVYLGATTPMVGSAIGKLSLSVNEQGVGTLFGSVWNYEENLDLNADQSYSLMTWNVGNLIQGALDMYSANSKHWYPIDRDLPSGKGSTPQRPELTPARYDGPGDGSSFANAVGVGSFKTTNLVPTVGPVNIPPVKITYVDKEPPVKITSYYDRANPNNSWLGAAWFWLENMAMGGYLERYDNRLDKYNAGELTYDQFVRANLDDTATTTGAFVVAGGAGKLSIKLLGSGWKGATASGMSAGAAFAAMEQAGANMIYIDTAGADGKQGIDWRPIGIAAVAGGALGLIAHWIMGKIFPDAHHAPVNRDLEQTAGGRVVPRTRSNEALPNDAIPAPIDRSTAIEVEGKVAVVSPPAGTMRCADASGWLVDNLAKLGEMVKGAPNPEIKVKQALQVLQDLRSGAQAAMVDLDLAELFAARYKVPTFESLKAKFSGHYSGEALYNRMLEEVYATEWVRFPENVGGCFIGSTRVHTDKGLVRIDQLQVGDMVLSQPEQGGEQAYKRVLKTFRYENKTIRAVTYCIPGSNDFATIYATDNHPFWVVEEERYLE